MKEPLVSKLMIPHASPLYHTGNNDKDGEEKSGKLKTSEILLSSTGITLAKINQSV
jgi:hypothetical protein